MKRVGPAMPEWVTEEWYTAILGIYEEAIYLTEVHGVPYVVDHIVPLKATAFRQGRVVHVACGLHVPWNLKAIPQTSNAEKTASLPPEIEWTAW